MKELISVIIPVYRAEKYLHKCINSILQQTYENFELILVDDGSPDNCGRICDEYAGNDNRIKVIHKENGGVSQARNYGLDSSSGKYIMFVDSDDYIESTMLEKLYDAMVSNNVDLTICGSYLLSDKAEPKAEVYSGNEKVEGVDDISHFVNKYYTNSVLRAPWGKLYKKEFCGKFDENITLAEDLLFVMEYIKKVKALYHVDLPLYYYNYDVPNSLTKKFEPEYFEIFCYIYDVSIELLQRNNKAEGYNICYCLLEYCRSFMISYSKNKYGSLYQYVKKMCLSKQLISASRGMKLSLVKTVGFEKWRTKYLKSYVCALLIKYHLWMLLYLLLIINKLLNEKTLSR